MYQTHFYKYQLSKNWENVPNTLLQIPTERKLGKLGKYTKHTFINANCAKTGNMCQIHFYKYQLSKNGEIYEKTLLQIPTKKKLGKCVKHTFANTN